jgi:hypothetical protein
MDAAIIEKEALLLPEGQRVELAIRLLESLNPIEPELIQAWVNEADSRMEDLSERRMIALGGPETMAELRARFRK